MSFKPFQLFLLFFALFCFAFILGCATIEAKNPVEPKNATNKTIPFKCESCPIFSPPSPAYCADGVLVPRVDDCGCKMPPGCNRNQSANETVLETHFCSESEKAGNACVEASPVCGWFNESIKCFAYPCAQTFSNPCAACRDGKVSHWTAGDCPKVGGVN